MCLALVPFVTMCGRSSQSGSIVRSFSFVDPLGSVSVENKNSSRGPEIKAAWNACARQLRAVPYVQILHTVHSSRECLETWFAAAALRQLSGSGGETSVPVAPGEEGPEGFRPGRGLCSAGCWVSCLGPEPHLILSVSPQRAAQSDPRRAHPFPMIPEPGRFSKPWKHVSSR